MAGDGAGDTVPVARPATSTPLGRISHSPPKVWVTWRLASSDTAVDTARRRIMGRRPGRNVSYQPLRPDRAEWNVPTAGMVVPTSAAWLGPGESGSWRWSTSGPKVRNASMVRRATARPLAMGATDPLLGRRVLGPTLVMPGSGGGPSHGATMRASTPRWRNARASPSTCPWTPPKSVSEYGHKSITLMPRVSLPIPGSSHPPASSVTWARHPGRWASSAAGGASGSAPHE